MPRKPIELDDARRRRLLAALEAGATIKMAAAAAGVSEDTLSRWRKAGPDLEADMQQAEAAGAVRALGVIQEAAASGTWQAAAWLLERRYPGEYGRRVPPVEDSKDLETVVSWLSAMQARAAKHYRKVALNEDMSAEDLEAFENPPEPPELLKRAEQVIRGRGNDLAFS